MLGKTASGLFWMYRLLERAENSARLLDAGFQMVLTRAGSGQREWDSALATAGQRDSYVAKYGEVTAENAIAFMLSDPDNPSSIYATVQAARSNARLVRTALTREVWEATNECWLTLQKLLDAPVPEENLPATLSTIRQQAALVRGATVGTMLRNDGYNFLRLGQFIERADNTARILDVKYYLLLPSVALVGSRLDIVQWETILRSVSAQRSYRWLNGSDISPISIANYLILHRQMPRSLAFCYSKIADNLRHLELDYGHRVASHERVKDICESFMDQPIERIFDQGLHEFITGFLADNLSLAAQIESDYNFLDIA